MFQGIKDTKKTEKLWESIISDSRTKKSNRNIAHYVDDLRSYTVAHPVLFALLCRYLEIKTSSATGRSKNVNLRESAKTINNCARLLSAFVLRVAHIQPSFQPSHFEKGFSSLAYKIFHGKSISAEKFLAVLKKCDKQYEVISDTRYKEKLSKISIRSSPKAKQIFIGIIHQQQPDIAVNQSRCTLEHILPKSEEHLSSKGWVEFNEDSHETYKNRLGNLILLHDTDNKPGKKHNSSFKAKVNFYKKSSFQLTKSLNRFTRWGPKEIDKRQKQIADQAAEVWSCKLQSR